MSFIWIGTEVPLPGHDIGKSIAWTVEAFFVESKDIYIYKDKSYKCSIMFDKKSSSVQEFLDKI